MLKTCFFVDVNMRDNLYAPQDTCCTCMKQAGSKSEIPKAKIAGNWPFPVPCWLIAVSVVFYRNIKLK